MKARSGAHESAEREPPESVAIVLNEGLELQRARDGDPVTEVLEILAQEKLPGSLGVIPARQEEEQVTSSPELAEAAARQRDELGVAPAHVGRRLEDEGHPVFGALLGGDQRLDVDDLRCGGQRDEGGRGGEENAREARQKVHDLRVITESGARGERG